MKKFLQSIFSVNNDYAHKIITILGIKIKFRNKHKEHQFRMEAICKKIKECEEASKKQSKKLDEQNKQINIQFKELKKLIVEPTQNIKKHLFDYAGAQTAKYVIEKMPKVPIFENSLDLLSFALSKVTNEGLYLEFGVFSGKTINHIASVVPQQRIYGFDSFEGLPEAWRSGFEKGKFVQNNLPVVNQNVCLVKGFFEDTLDDFTKENTDKCAFIHIDCDLYSAAKTVFENLKNRIVPGTVIVFDEYFNYPGWQEHEFKAFQEMIEAEKFEYDYIGYVSRHQQVGIIIKEKTD